jgi:hypothetical protein
MSIDDSDFDALLSALRDWNNARKWLAARYPHL